MNVIAPSCLRLKQANLWRVLLIFTISVLGLALLRIDFASLSESLSSSSSHKASSLAVDVLSVGSKNRWDMITRQQNTWALHSSIRHFEVVHEGHHEAYGNATCTNLTQQFDECEEKGKVPPDQQGRRYYVAPEIVDLFIFRHQSEEWKCAQRRPLFGLHQLFSQRYTNKCDYPDWLLIVDDDTYFNMDILNYVLSRKDPNKTHVFVGKHIHWNWAYGGFGTALSRGALQRLYTPIYCQQHHNKFPANNRGLLNRDLRNYMTSVCKAINEKNLIFESEQFREGMSLLELMVEIQLHRRPFCWHSDWFLGWFFAHHILLGKGSPELFPPCHPYECQPRNDSCLANWSLMCHQSYPME